MNVIFLDVDGVIDSKHRRNYLDEAKLAHLVHACSETASRVVISSHWRLVQPQHSRLRAVLRHLGVEVIGATPVRPPSEPQRPLEILEWISNYNSCCQSLERPAVTGFAVLDDRDLLHELGGEQLQGHF